MNWARAYTKFIIAIAAAVAAAVSVTADGEFGLNDAFVMASGFFGALAVAIVPNTGPDAPNPPDVVDEG